MDSSGKIYWNCVKCDVNNEAGHDCWKCGAEDETEEHLSRGFQSLIDAAPVQSMEEASRSFKKVLRKRGRKMGLR